MNENVWTRVLALFVAISSSANVQLDLAVEDDVNRTIKQHAFIQCRLASLFYCRIKFPVTSLGPFCYQKIYLFPSVVWPIVSDSNHQSCNLMQLTSDQMRYGQMLKSHL